MENDRGCNSFCGPSSATIVRMHDTVVCMSSGLVSGVNDEEEGVLTVPFVIPMSALATKAIVILTENPHMSVANVVTNWLISMMFFRPYRLDR